MVWKSDKPGKHVAAQRAAIENGALRPGGSDPQALSRSVSGKGYHGSASGTGYATSAHSGAWDDRSWTTGKEVGCSIDHAAPFPVFTSEGIVIHAGGAIKTKWAKPDPRPGNTGVLLDLADVWNVSSVISAPGIEGFATPHVPRIAIRWADYGAPVVSKAEWGRIADLVKKFGGATISCQGGHGRTGTCLAILGCLLGLIPENMDPIKYVRKVYCNKAVESKEQVRYVHEITGRICASGASK